jgi:hypothetical protein
MKTLDSTERQVLVNKYCKSGLTFEESVIKVNKFHDYLKNLRDRLRERKVSDNEITTRFKEEFYKICSKLET